jgi:hypothetical protein
MSDITLTLIDGGSVVIPSDNVKEHLKIILKACKMFGNNSRELTDVESTFTASGSTLPAGDNLINVSFISIKLDDGTEHLLNANWITAYTSTPTTFSITVNHPTDTTPYTLNFTDSDLAIPSESAVKNAILKAKKARNSTVVRVAQ